MLFYRMELRRHSPVRKVGVLSLCNVPRVAVGNWAVAWRHDMLNELRNPKMRHGKGQPTTRPDKTGDSDWSRRSLPPGTLRTLYSFRRRQIPACDAPRDNRNRGCGVMAPATIGRNRFSKFASQHLSLARNTGGLAGHFRMQSSSSPV